MRPLATLALAAATGLAACTPMQWVKPDVAAEQVGRDERACQQSAWREASTRTWYYQRIGPIVIQDSLGRQSVVWPSGAFVDPFGHQFLEESRLAHFCMESKGYQLAPAEKKK